MLAYADLLAADTGVLHDVASMLRRGLTVLGSAEDHFRKQVVRPIAAQREWQTTATGHAQHAAAVHVHSCTVATEELAVAARALDVFADDLAQLQTLIRRATVDAFADGVAVAGDGSTRVARTTVTAGETELVDPSILAGRLAAEHTFHRQRDAILELATKIDTGCADVLRRVAAGADQVVIDSANQQTALPWKQDPKDLTRLELMFNVNPDAGQDKAFAEYSKISQQFMQLMGASGETGKRIHASVQNAKAFLDSNGDPDERAIAQRIVDTWDGVDRMYSPHSTEFTAKALPVMDLLFNIAKYSAQTHSTIQISVESGVATISSTLGSIGGASAGVGICGALNLPDEEVGFLPCAALATFVGSVFGGGAGSNVGEKVNKMIYRDTGGTIPDPFLTEYRTTHR